MTNVNTKDGFRFRYLEFGIHLTFACLPQAGILKFDIHPLRFIGSRLSHQLVCTKQRFKSPCIGPPPL